MIWETVFTVAFFTAVISFAAVVVILDGKIKLPKGIKS